MKSVFKTRDLELPFFDDLSQLVGRTPWDTPVPFYTHTSPGPSLKIGTNSGWLLAISR